MLQRLHERGFDDFEAAHLIVFQYPGPEGGRPSELAARLRISKQALNYLLGQLERLNYLERRPDPDDLRSKRIALTRRGEAAVGVIREAVTEMELAWAQQLGETRFADLRAALLDLNQLIASVDPSAEPYVGSGVAKRSAGPTAPAGSAGAHAPRAKRLPVGD